MVGNTDSLQTVEQKVERMNGLASATAGGSAFDPALITKIHETLDFLNDDSPKTPETVS